MEKVFVTGRGLVTPLGTGIAANEAALRSGKSGITVVPEFSENRLESIVGGIPEQNPACDLLDRKTKRFCPPAGVMSAAAAIEAFAEAGIAPEQVKDFNMALVGGQASSNCLEIHSCAKAYVDRG